jgi:hypothetical protein
VPPALILAHAREGTPTSVLIFNGSRHFKDTASIDAPLTARGSKRSETQRIWCGSFPGNSEVSSACFLDTYVTPRLYGRARSRSEAEAGSN